MFNNILVAVDGSQPSHHALQVADATLTIHHLLEATRQGHPTTTTLQIITQNPPNPTLAPTPPIPPKK